MAKKQQGTHSVKTRSEGSYSKSKIYKQKGTGGARHGDRNAPIFRKGGVYKGPVPRSHAHKLNKKFQNLPDQKIFQLDQTMRDYWKELGPLDVLKLN